MALNLRAIVLPAIAAALVLATAPTGQAASVCTGTVSGSPLRPIAKPVVVSLVHGLDSTANPELAQQFMAGLQSAGVTVVPEGQGTTTLDLSFLLHGKRNGTYHDLTWMRGTPASDNVTSSLAGSRIDVTIYARDAASRSLVWTGVIGCTIQTADGGALAEGLGAAVGRSVGQSVPRRAM